MKRRLIELERDCGFSNVHEGQWDQVLDLEASRCSKKCSLYTIFTELSGKGSGSGRSRQISASWLRSILIQPGFLLGPHPI